MIAGLALQPDTLLTAAFKAARQAAAGGNRRTICLAAAKSIAELTGASGAMVLQTHNLQQPFCQTNLGPQASWVIKTILTACKCPNRFCYRPLENCLENKPLQVGTRTPDVTHMACLPFELGPGRSMIMRLFFNSANPPRAAVLEPIQRNLQLVFDIALLCMGQQRCLHAIDMAGAQLAAGRTEAEIAKATVDHVTAALSARGSIFWILDTSNRQVATCLTSGFAYKSLLQVEYQALEKIFAFEKLTPVVIEDARYDCRIPNLERLGKKRIVSLAGFPAAIGRTYLGLLAVYFGSRRKLEPHEQDFLASMAQQASIALSPVLDKQHGGQDLQKTVAAMAAAIEAKDYLTHVHSLNVAELARVVCKWLNLPDSQSRAVHHGALLHDIGKIGVTDRVLARLGQLDKDQMEQLKRHPEIGARILSRLPNTEELLPIVRHHHERYDGRGYPDRLAKEAIPLGARILAVCDALETMLCGRPRIPACSLEKAMAQLEAGSGHRFDPRIVKVVVARLRENPLPVSRFKPRSAPGKTRPSGSRNFSPGNWCNMPTSF